VSYRVELKRSASKALDAITPQDRRRILEALASLQMIPGLPAVKSWLTGTVGRIRSQNYRVIYEIDDKAKQILVLVIGHRRDVYP